MSGKFMGSYNGSISNRRVSIPQPFRNVIAPSAKMQVVALRGKNNTIYIFPMDNWKILEDQLENGTDQQRELLKMFQFYAAPLKIEGPGRILLPKKLVEIANIDNAIVFLGEGKYFSIWNLNNFGNYEKEISQHYDEKFDENKYII